MLVSGCGSAPRPDPPVAAYELSLPTQRDREEFTRTLRDAAEANGFHVDAATPAQLHAISEVSPITLNATVWEGRNDDEVVASAMDSSDHVGRIWISFFYGSHGADFAGFRHDAFVRLRSRWPGMTPLPIMPSGAIPLARDLVRTPRGYRVDPAAAYKYR